jgi:Secretion system C-terminal sorting domain/Beta-propeller repeat
LYHYKAKYKIAVTINYEIIKNTHSNILKSKQMKKILLQITLITFSVSAFAQNLEWAKSMGGTNADVANSIAVDALGNVYTAGTFFGNDVDFDPDPMKTAYLTSGIAGNIFISKLDKYGTFVWAKTIGSTSDEVSIAVDGSGNVYTTSSSGGISISKLDENGNFVWTKSIGGTGSAEANSITVDGSGNVYTTGFFFDTVDFDPDPVKTSYLTSANGNTTDIFISKLDAAGTFVWAKSMGGTGSDDARSITVDAAGNVYTTGIFKGTANFNTNLNEPAFNLNSAGNTDIFISKLDINGNLLWAKNIGGTGNDLGNSIAVDGSGNVYTTGYFTGNNIDFNPDPDPVKTYPLTSAGGMDIFISKLDGSGNFVWAKKMGAVTPDVGQSIAVDGLGNVYTTGYFFGTVDFNPDPDPMQTYPLTSNGSYDIFISKLDPSGNFVWAESMGGVNGIDQGNSIALDGSGNVYVTGVFSGMVDFDSDPIKTTELNSVTGSTDAFVLKLNDLTVLPITLLSFEAAKKENDTYLTWETASESNTDKFELERSENGLAFNYIGEIKAAGNSDTKRSYHFSDKYAGTDFPNQDLYYRFKQIDLDGKFTYSPIRSVKFENSLAGSYSQVQVYPNPAKDMIRIQGNAGSAYIITNQTGTQVLSGRLNNSTTSVDISKLNAGFYFIQVGELNTQIFKLVKQ